MIISCLLLHDLKMKNKVEPLLLDKTDIVCNILARLHAESELLPQSQHNC